MENARITDNLIFYIDKKTKLKTKINKMMIYQYQIYKFII